MRGLFGDKSKGEPSHEGQSMFGLADTVYISGTLYAKTPEAYAAAKKAALETGYEETDYSKKNSDPAASIYVSLSDKINFAQCISCNSVISRKGVGAHNHTCEKCGVYTAQDFTRDGAIRLRFIDKRRPIGNPVTFRIYDYRQNPDGSGELLVYPTPLTKDYRSPDGRVFARRGLFDTGSQDEALALLEDAKHLYRRSIVVDPQTKEEIPVLIIKDAQRHFITDESVFNTMDIFGSVINYRSIKIWDGKQYGDFERLPIPDSMTISAAYADGHKHDLSEPKIHETIMSAASQVSSADFYHQDGRPAFSGVVYDRMNHFVQHFVNVDFKEWQSFLAAAPADGPGFIYALAKWCAKQSDGKPRHVRDEPNFGNTLYAMGTQAQGGTLTYSQAVAAEAGGNTEEARLFAEANKRALTVKAEAIQRRGRRRRPGMS